MKKLFALLFAVLLTLSCTPVLAQETTSETYVFPLLGYSLQVPEGWLVVDYTNVDDYIAAFQSGEMTFPGTTVDTLKQIAPQIKQTNGAVMINQNAFNVMMTGVNVGMPVTKEQFISLILPSMENQILTEIPGAVVSSSGEVLSLGNHEFISLTVDYNISGVGVTADQLYLLDGSYLHIFNMTITNLFGEEAVNAFYADVATVLESLKMPE